MILGDKNTRYFQTMVKQRRATSRILHLKTNDGEVIEDQGGIEQLLLQHFKQSNERTTTTNVNYILEEIKTLPIPQISNQQTLALTALVTMKRLNSLSSTLELSKHQDQMKFQPFSIRNIRTW